ncbi:S8 family peptidase, partial [Candidatus Bathyarchaeota archaeon]|nr:S8 family peptidase [Candidatus Bathyarchaeota archaeon]
MKIVTAFFMLTLLLIQSFTILSMHESSESLDIHHTQRNSGANIISNLHEETRSTNYSVTQAKSMVRVHKGQNQTASVILGCQTNLRYLSVGLSTIVKPPYEIESKIDANLLNLTGLVTKGNLHNNQTNVIISISNNHLLQQSINWTVQKNLFETRSELYTSTHAYDDMHFLAARLNYSEIFDLARNSYVDHIWLDRRFTVCLDQSVDIIKNPVEWANFESSFGRNINGSGVKIAILDTGIDSTHPDFYFPNGTSSIANAISFTGESTADKFGHGTHCASIAAGTGAANNGQYVGVALGATLLNVKVLNNQGKGMESWIISGIQWAVDNNAKILSMSFKGSISSDGTDPISTTVNWATEQGVVCVVAAGNHGPEMYSITSPGVAESAITVGASHKNDAIASFSSRGPTSSFTIKPDILAPGVDIIAARANGTNMGTPVSQFYTMASGTSMATPHATG